MLRENGALKNEGSLQVRECKFMKTVQYVIGKEGAKRAREK